MAFTLSGSTITQTGTDVVTSASTIPGTTKSTVRSRVTQFNFGGNTLVVNGTLTMPEKIRFTNLVLGTTSTGTLNVGELKTDPIDYKYCGGMDALETVGTVTQTFTNLTLNVFGQRVFFTTGYLSLNQPFRFEHSHVVVQGRFNLAGNGYISRNTRITTISGLNANPIIFILANTGGWESTIVDSTQSGQDIYFALSNLTPGGTYEFENIGLATGQALMAYGQQSAPGPTFNVYQLSVGAAYTLVQTAGRYYILNLYHRFIDAVSDAAGNPVQDAVVYLAGGAGTAIQALTDSAGQTAQAFLYHSNTLFNGVETRTEYLSGNTITKRIASYLHLLPAASSFDVRTATPSVASLTLVGDPSLTQTNRVTVDAYTTLETSAKLYDRAKSWLVDNYTGQAATLVSRSGTLIDAGIYNVTIDATAAQAFALSGNTITIKASIYTGDMTTTGVITLANGAQFAGTRTDANGTIAPPVLQSVTVSNGVAGTLLLIQDVTNPAAPVTLYLGTPASWPHTWTDSADYVADRDIRVRAAYRSGVTAKLFVDELIGTATDTAPALAYRLNQQDDVVYNTLAQDGSTVSGITINDVALLIEVTTGSIEWGALYAYEVYWLATAAGIVDEGRIINALDSANYVFEGAWKIKNVSTPVVPLVITGGWGRSASDNTTQSLIDTTGGPIFAAPDQVYVTTITTSAGVVTGDISEVQGLVQAGMTAQGYTTARAAQLDVIEAAPTVPTAAANAAAVRAELTAEMTRLLEIAKLHGLVEDAPLRVSATQRTAGDIVQTITEAGGTTIVTREA